MSRVGKRIINLPDGVTIDYKEGKVVCKGSLGSLSQNMHPLVELVQDGNEIKVSPKNNSVEAKAMHGTQRALLANMVEGVSKGFEKKLELRQLQVKSLNPSKTTKLTKFFALS